MTPHDTPAAGHPVSGTALTRRQLLRGLAAGGAAAAGGALLATDHAGATAPVAPRQAQPAAPVDVQLTLAPGWPFPALPAEGEPATDPRQDAFAETLRAWQELNPGVEVEQIEFNIWDQEGLVTAVAGGTAPSLFHGSVLGGWDNAATFAAFKQGLAADVTDLVAKYGTSDKLADYVRAPWAQWSVDGRYYAAPQAYVPGNGIYFRRDLITELGLEEPQPGWTWEDFRTLAKGLTEGDRKGAALQRWGSGWTLSASGFDLLTTIPDPEASWHWRRDYTSQLDKWVSRVQLYRDMVFTDQSIVSDISFTDPEVLGAFVNGSAAMFANNSSFFLNTGDDGPLAMANALGKPLEEVVGWIQHPVGDLQIANNTQPFVSILSFSPDLEGDALDKGYALFDHMFFGPGFTQLRVAAYEASQDLRVVYDDVVPVNGLTTIEGVPGTPTDAWGEKYITAVEDALAIPLPPDRSQYIPAETETGPTDDAAEDASSRWSFEAGELDIAALLRDLEETQNSQMAGFESGVPREDFIAGAKAYYEAHNAFWEQHSPEFHANIFRPWYEENVAPALGA
jgi:hypothetical protein